MSEWMPIETAPKDGTPILIYAEDCVIEASCLKEYQRWDVVRLDVHGCGCCGGPSPKPTHWMPRPEPPKVKP